MTACGSATAAPLSAPALRRRRSTAKASSESKTGCSQPSRRPIHTRSIRRSRPEARRSMRNTARAAPPVAARAVLRIERRASGRERLIDRVWIGRRLGCEQPVFESLDAFAVERRRRSAGAESGAAVALPHAVIIAVPMELHLALFALALIPY